MTPVHTQWCTQVDSRWSFSTCSLPSGLSNCLVSLFTICSLLYVARDMIIHYFFIKKKGKRKCCISDK